MADPTRADGSIATVLGGNNGLVDSASTERGVHSQYPATQLKYFTSWDKAKRSMARLFVPFSSASDRAKFLANFQDSEALKSVSALVSNSGYIDFLLHQVNESVEEKLQVIELLNDEYVAYFFGQKAPMFQYSGTMFTTVQDDWWRAFTQMYNGLLRGSKLADFSRLVSLRYDSRIVTGALTNFTGTLTSEQQQAVNFSFNLLVKRIDIVPPMKTISDASWVSTPTAAEGQATTGLSASTLEALSAPGATLGSTAIVGTVTDAGVPTKTSSPTGDSAAASTSSVSTPPKNALPASIADQEDNYQPAPDTNPFAAG